MQLIPKLPFVFCLSLLFAGGEASLAQAVLPQSVLAKGGLAQRGSAEKNKMDAFNRAIAKPFYDVEACRTQDRAVWAYGWNFALLTALQCTGKASEEVMNKQIQAVRQLERGLGVVTPDLFSRAGNKVQRTVAAVLYFSKGPGYRLSREISKKLGYRSGALFEFAIKSGLLMVLYSEKGDLSNQSLLKALERSSLVAGIPDRLVDPLRKGIQSRLPYKEVKNRVFSQAAKIKTFLRGKETTLRPVVKSVGLLPALVRDFVTPFLKVYPKSKDPESKNAFRFRGNMFSFGIDLSLVSFQRAQGKDASAKLKKLRAISKVFGVKFPPFVGIGGKAFDDPRKGTGTMRSLQATTFLLKGGAPQLARAMGKRKGLGHAAAAVELGIKAFLASRYQNVYKNHLDRMDREFERLGRKLYLPSRTIVKFQGIYREKDARKRAGIVIGLMRELKEMGAK